MKITYAQLVEAFEKYNKDALQNPDDYSEINDTKECAIAQADKLISYL